jgi:hypothetical protein
MVEEGSLYGRTDRRVVLYGGLNVSPDVLEPFVEAPLVFSSQRPPELLEPRLLLA